MWKSKNEKIKMKVYTKMKNKNEKSDVHVLEQIFNLKLPKQSTDSLISTKSLLGTEKFLKFEMIEMRLAPATS